MFSPFMRLLQAASACPKSAARPRAAGWMLPVLALMALGLTLLAAPMCAASVFYVSLAGSAPTNNAPPSSDTNLGSQLFPKLTIQAAVNAAQSGDTVVVESGTYSGAGNRDIDFGGKSLIVTSQSGAGSTVINCGGSSGANHRGFNLHSGETGAIINGFTIQNGYESSSPGGAVSIAGGTSVTLSNCTFTSDTVAGGGTGGGVYNSGTATLTSCTFSASSTSGGLGQGGGLYNNNTGTATLTQCTFSNNSSGGEGGGLYNLGTATLTSCAFTGNTASGAGGGGLYDAGTATVTTCTFTGNSSSGSGANGGGGGVFNSGTTTLTGCTLSSNTAGGLGGGGVYNGGTVTLTGCTLSSNSANSTSGGGIFNSSAFGTVSVTNCTFTGNSASTGGGISNASGGSGTIGVTNCLFTGNSATSGGGIFNNNIGSRAISVTNCTLTANSASSGGGIFNTGGGSGTITLTNDIVYGDTGGEIVNNTGTTSSVTFSDVQGGFAGTGNINADPLFVNAPSDLHLQIGSPALGAGTGAGAPATDLDGKPRRNPPTIGTYEYRYLFVSAASGSDSNLGNQAAPLLTIRAAVTAAQFADTVVVAGGTYSGAGNRDIDFGGKGLTVTSQNGTVTIDCGGAASVNGSGNHRGFNLHSGETGAVISGFTVQNGFTSVGSGGAVFLGGGTSVTLANCTFTGSTVTGAGVGGGVYNAGTATLTNCTFSGDTTSSLGGGLYNSGTATLTGCTLNGDSATSSSGGGGGIYNTGTMTLTNSTLTGDTDSGVGGGGLYSTGTATLAGCSVTGNTDSGFGGGGVYNAGTTTLTNCSVTGNTDSSLGGGGVYSSGTVTLTGCTLSRNTAPSGLGGAVFVAAGGSAVLTACTVTGNTVGGSSNSGGGGGVFNDGTAAVTACTFTGNADSGLGGGGLYNSGTAALTNCVFTGNISEFGGGVCNGVSFLSSVSGTMTLTNCTLTQNVAGSSVYNLSGSLTLTNDIVYGNPGGEIDGPVTATFCDVRGGYPGNGNISSDPLFVSAPTNLHLRPGSLCFSAGTGTGAPLTDLDGNATAAANPASVVPLTPRPILATLLPTIGAFEVTQTGQLAASGHTHLLWNNTDARVMLWSVALDGSFTLNGFGPYTDGAPQNVWHATAVATGADGLSHLLWNNTDGRVMLWTVDDSGNFTLAGYGPYTDGAPQNKWSAIGVSVGPDNVVHLLWNNTDHRVMLWNVDQLFNFTLAGYGPYTDGAPQNLWSATALSTGPDNMSHILWNNTDGRVMLWDVTSAFNFTLAGYGPYTDGAPQNKWSAIGASVGPDNIQHLLWTNTDHRAMFWDVNPDFSFTLAGYGPYTDGAPQNIWTATAVATGPNGLSHILWDNTDFRAMLWNVNNGFDFKLVGYGPYTDNAPQNLWSATAVSAGP